MITIGLLAQMVGLPRGVVFAWLRKNRYLSCNNRAKPEALRRGLLVERDGRVWVTERGEQVLGDELRLLKMVKG